MLTSCCRTEEEAQPCSRTWTVQHTNRLLHSPQPTGLCGRQLNSLQSHHMQQLGQRNANHKAEGKKLSSQIVCSCGLRAANPLPTAAPRSRAAHTHTHTHHLPATGDAQQHVSSSVSTVSAPQTPPAHARISQRCSSRGRQAASLLSADAAQKHGLQTQGQRCHTACRCQADGANPPPCRG